RPLPGAPRRAARSDRSAAPRIIVRVVFPSPQRKQGRPLLALRAGRDTSLFFRHYQPNSERFQEPHYVLPGWLAFAALVAADQVEPDRAALRQFLARDAGSHAQRFQEACERHLRVFLQAIAAEQVRVLMGIGIRDDGGPADGASARPSVRYLMCLEI